MLRLTSERTGSVHCGQWCGVRPCFYDTGREKIVTTPSFNQLQHVITCPPSPRSATVSLPAPAACSRIRVVPPLRDRRSPRDSSAPRAGARACTSRPAHCCHCARPRVARRLWRCPCTGCRRRNARCRPATLPPSYAMLSWRVLTFYPLTHSTCLRVCITSIKSSCCAITRSISLYAAGISSITEESLRHSTPAVCLATSSTLNVRVAAARLIIRPAPCEHEQNDSGLPLPRTT